jgi:hypothetical protein
MAKTKKWPGLLGKRIALNTFPSGRGSLNGIDLHSVGEDLILRKRLAKLPLLFDHFKVNRPENANEISGEDLLSLVLALATEFVEGFKLAKKVPAKRGPRGPNWKGVDGLILFKEVQAIVRHEGISAEKALRMIRELSPRRYAHYDHDALKARYHEARRRYAKASKDVS